MRFVSLIFEAMYPSHAIAGQKHPEWKNVVKIFTWNRFYARNRLGTPVTG
jgi:hypothetical protein